MESTQATNSLSLDPAGAWMHPADIARSLGVTRKTVVGWITAGELPAVDVSSPGTTRTSYRVSPAALAEMIAARDAGVSGAQRATVADVAQRWLDAFAAEVADGTKSAKTLASCQQVTRYYVLPTLGHRRMADLCLLDVERLGVKLREDGYSARTRNLTRTVLGQIVRRARLDRIVPDAFDPVRGSTAASAADDSLTKRGRKIQGSLERDEVAALLAALEGSTAHLPAKLLARTGLRVGEMLGLAWDAVDLDSGHLVVARNLTTYHRPATADEPGRSVESLGTPKTASSRRRVKLSADLVADLRRHKAEQSAERPRVIGWGAGWPVSFVFTSPTGGPLNRGRFGRDLTAAGKDAGIGRKVTPHVLRHTAGTQVRAAGVSLPAVAALLGHASPLITAAYYDHALEGERDAAADALTEALG